MKLFIIDTQYPRFIESFYKNNPEAIKKDYNSQKQLIFNELFGTCNFYSKNLQKLGHQAEDFIINNEILQKQWAKENGVKLYFQQSFLRNIKYIRHFYNKEWVYKILDQQIKQFKPDVIYSKNLQLDQKFLNSTKKYCKILVGQIACPMVDKKYFEPYDLIISALPYYVKMFREWGKKSEFLRLGFEPSILEKLKPLSEKYDIVHIGAYGKPFHTERTNLLENAADKIKIDFWGYGSENLGKNSSILKNYHGQAWGKEMYNILFNSKICLNYHGDYNIVRDHAANIRLFEATGAGSLLMTDRKSDLKDIFEIGKEVEDYGSPEELVEKAKYYLGHEQERSSIAEAGLQRTIKDHSWEKRMEELLNILSKYI